MKPKERQLAILDYLKTHGKTAVELLANYFNTTGTTIRKDLSLLEREQKVLRTYGSVMIAHPSKSEDELPLVNKTTIHLAIKKRIAKMAASLLKDGDSLIIDSGSTVLQMIPHFAHLNNLAIMTNSLHIMNSLVALEKEHQLLICGGTYRTKSASFHGVLAESAFKQFSFDKLFIGTDGFDLELGLTTFNEVHGVSQAMTLAAKEIIVLTDSSKFGRRSPNIVCPLEKINMVITDSGIPQTMLQALQDKKIPVLIVENEQKEE